MCRALAMAAARMIPLAHPKMSHTATGAAPLLLGADGTTTTLPPTETFVDVNTSRAASAAATTFDFSIITP